MKGRTKLLGGDRVLQLVDDLLVRHQLGKQDQLVTVPVNAEAIQRNQLVQQLDRLVALEDRRIPFFVGCLKK